MKEGIHPDYKPSVVKCACGETFETYSIKPELRVEICSKCHPYYTGSQKNTVVGGRSERFKAKFNIKDED